MTEKASLKTTVDTKENETLDPKQINGRQKESSWMTHSLVPDEFVFDVFGIPSMS